MMSRTILHATIPGSSKNGLDANETVPNNIERIAIDHSGSIGSFYNAYEDSIKGKLDMNFKSQSNESTKQIESKLIKGRTPDSQNLLKFVDIDHQLRLSIELKMIPAVGIASLIEYSRSIDRHTRLLYVYQESFIHSCRDRLEKMRKMVKSLTSETFATHIVTEIIWGIHLLIILQLPTDQEDEIDLILSKIHHCLSNNEYTLELESKDKTLLDQIISITVYSNIADLSKMIKLEDVYQRTVEMKKNNSQYQPMKYILTPIHWFHGEYDALISKFVSSEPNEIETIEHYLLQQSSELKLLNLRINDALFELLKGKLNIQQRNIQQELSRLQILHFQDIERIRDIVVNIRKGKEHQNLINKEVSLDPPIEIQRIIDKIYIQLKELQSKGNLIKQLKNDKFKYCNVDTLGIREGLTEERVNDMLFGNDSHKVIFYSTDTLRNNDEEKWTRIYSEMIEERKNNPQLSLIYADFTYSTYKLKNLVVTVSSDMIGNNNQSNFQPSGSDAKKEVTLSPPLVSPTKEIINILLLGESGVGKSTFINAFANYLHFESLRVAEKGNPVVIIPVTFLMTINDTFDEHVIKFGEADPNEDHNNSGQSVTQQCKSYVFNISDTKKLRIIDTPGFGDTRGSDQDDFNMEEIFSFLNNFNYLNGICLLFKPEVAQLNRYFRSCCVQLFDYFGENIVSYFIFCFTNARSTFFAPGNTRPLLQTFFQSFPALNIPFKKRNTFCFDSESFRYLVAIQNSIKFDSSERNEFEQSWVKSVTESKRFRDFLCGQDPYRRNCEWKSIKDAQFQINYMIRPILEGMRNLLRDVLLYDDHSSIELRATHLNRSKIICYKCSRTPQEYGQFWILPDLLHKPSNKCASNERKSTEYSLDYELISDQTKEPRDDLKKQLKSLYRTGAKFFLFLTKKSQSQQSDPFLAGIERMINEEKFICQIQNVNDSNQDLITELERVKTNYGQKANLEQLDRENLTLSNIYELIKSVNEIPMVKIQLDAIRKYQQLSVENNQRVIDINGIH